MKFGQFVGLTPQPCDLLAFLSVAEKTLECLDLCRANCVLRLGPCVVEASLRCDLVLTDLVAVSVCDFQVEQDLTTKLLQFACDFLVRLIDCGSCALRVHQVDVLEVDGHDLR